MAVLKEGDFELDGYKLSGTEKDAVYIRGFNPGSVDHRTQDTPNPVGDNVLFGRDYLTPASWKFNLRIRRSDIGRAAGALGGLVRSWRADNVRHEPGEVSTLRYSRGGVSRRVYGRARGLIPGLEDAWHAGIIDAEASFDLYDVYHYDDELQTKHLDIVRVSSGGVVLPTTWPLQLQAGGERQGVIDDVGGEAPAPFSVTFNGPIRDPYVRVSGVEIQLLTSLKYDQTATVDTLWMTATRDDGTNLSGALSRNSRLSGVRMNPGPAELAFGGIDSTGTSSADVQWRHTYYAF